MNKAEKQVIKLQLNKEQAAINDLERQYKQALKDIEDRIKLLQADELTQSKIYQLQYQKALRGQVEGILDKLQGDEYATIQQYLHDSYQDGFIGAMYSVHGQGIPLILPLDQNAAVKAVITDSQISEGLYNHIGVNIKQLKQAIRQEITRGLAANMPLADIARNIANRSKAPLSRAKTIVRTEGHRIQQASANDAREAAKANGCDVVKQWDGTLDSDTRSTHRRLDGQIRETNEPFEMDGKTAMYPGDFGKPEEDCNCRCVALTRAKWALDEDELKVLKERAKAFGLTEEEKKGDFKAFEEKYLKAAQTVEKAEKTDHPAKNKNGDVIIFDERLNTEKRQEQIAVLKQLSDEYNTKLTVVRPYEVGENKKRIAGQVSPWGEMKLSSVKPDVAVHEFAHSLATTNDKKYGLDGNEAFWKDIRKIRKEYQNAKRFNPGIVISAYADDDLDEFFAEAFALAKGKEMGVKLPDTYGNDLTYANRVLDAVNKHFGKEKSVTKAAETLINQGKSDIIKLGNKEVRTWYIDRVRSIPDNINQSLPMAEKARLAFEERNRIRTEARNMMADETAREVLDRKKPNSTFEELVKSKMERKGMTRDEAIADVYKTATKTNANVNRELGLEDD